MSSTIGGTGGVAPTPETTKVEKKEAHIQANGQQLPPTKAVQEELKTDAAKGKAEGGPPKVNVARDASPAAKPLRFADKYAQVRTSPEEAAKKLQSASKSFGECKTRQEFLAKFRACNNLVKHLPKDARWGGIRQQAIDAMKEGLDALQAKDPKGAQAAMEKLADSLSRREAFVKRGRQDAKRELMERRHSAPSPLQTAKQPPQPAPLAQQEGGRPRARSAPPQPKGELSASDKLHMGITLPEEIKEAPKAEQLPQTKVKAKKADKKPQEKFLSPSEQQAYFKKQLNDKIAQFEANFTPEQKNAAQHYAKIQKQLEFAKGLYAADDEFRQVTEIKPLENALGFLAAEFKNPEDLANLQQLAKLYPMLPATASWEFLELIDEAKRQGVDLSKIQP